MSFPTSLPSYVITAGAETLNGAAGGTGLSGLLNAFETDVTALGTKMGTGSATPALNKVLVGNGAGTSTWSTSLAGLTLTTAVLTAPTLADFTNATHAHTAASSGGILSLFGTIAIQKFSGSGTYTPAAKMIYCIIEVVGGGGGGGGAQGAAGAAYSGAGGGAGGYSRLIATAVTIGASKAVTIGGGGAGSSGASGGNGSDSSVGTLCIGKGGLGGTFGSSGAGLSPTPGSGGVAGTGDVTLVGNAGCGPTVQGASTTFMTTGGAGGASYFGGGAKTVSGVGNAAGNAGTTGSGGSGGITYNTAANVAGGNGGDGFVLITEFCTL